MSDGVKVSGLYEVEAEFRLAAANLLPEVQKVVKKGAVNIKKDWRRTWSGIRHAPRIGLSIDFDTYVTPRAVGAVIGPQDRPRNQGFLGRIIEEGGIHNAPHPGGSPALDREAPKFEAALVAVTRRLTP